MVEALLEARSEMSSDKTMTLVVEDSESDGEMMSGEETTIKTILLVSIELRARWICISRVSLIIGLLGFGQAGIDGKKHGCVGARVFWRAL